MRILIVDDEHESLISLKRLFKRRGFSEVDAADSGKSAVKKILSNNYDIVLLDLMLPDLNGLEVLEQTKPTSYDTEFIILTAVDKIETAVNATKLGAYDFLVKPAEPEKIFHTIERAFERKGLVTTLQGNSDNDASKLHPAFAPIITRSLKMIDILKYVEVMSKSRNPIMITGESGTGKELLARAIHKINNDKAAPFIAVNVASVPESLFESHLFGHTKGAFTGAVKSHSGYFEQANGGTLLLDEIGDLPLNQQAKILRVIEDRVVVPVGDTKPRKVNVSIISATNINIIDACKTGKFRLDLFFRLKSIHVHLPSLRDRTEDIITIADSFVKKFSKKYNKPIRGLTDESKKYLVGREYQGNVRELQQIVENAVLICEGTELTPTDFGIILESSLKNSLPTLRENTDRHYIKILNYVGGDKKAASEILGITLRQVQRKLRELQDDPRWKGHLNFDNK